MTPPCPIWEPNRGTHQSSVLDTTCRLGRPDCETARGGCGLGVWLDRQSGLAVPWSGHGSPMIPFIHDRPGAVCWWLPRPSRSCRRSLRGSRAHPFVTREVAYSAIAACVGSEEMSESEVLEGWDLNGGLGGVNWWTLGWLDRPFSRPMEGGFEHSL